MARKNRRDEVAWTFGPLEPEKTGDRRSPLRFREQTSVSLIVVPKLNGPKKPPGRGVESGRDDDVQFSALTFRSGHPRGPVNQIGSRFDLKPPAVITNQAQLQLVVIHESNAGEIGFDQIITDIEKDAAAIAAGSVDG